MSRQTFLQGALFLIFAGMITRLLGFINRLVLARMMGEEGVGLYMMALPTLFLIITLTQLGLPVAISKRVSEAYVQNKQKKIKQIITTAILLTFITSTIFTTILILGAPILADYFLTDSRTIYPLLVMSPIVPIIALSSVIKGYFQGMQNMKPQSYALIIEQFARITFVALFIIILLPYGIEFAAAGAMFSVVIGEFCSLIYLIYTFKRQKTIRIRKNLLTVLHGSKKTLTELFSIALPSTGSRLIGSISNFLEPILVTQSLAIAGISSTIVTKQYGELMGYVMPLLFLPTFITNSLSIALIPSISEAEAKENRAFTHYRIHQSIRISFASGALATIILSLFSAPILMFMYKSVSAKYFLVFMAPFFILLYIQSPLQASLQSLDLARPAMWNSLIGNIVKLSVMFLLASHPHFGMMGVAIAIIVGILLTTCLHFITLYQAIHFTISLKDISKMFALMSLTWIVGTPIKHIYEFYSSFYAFIFGIFILAVVYVILLFLLRFIKKEELQQIPYIKHWIK